MQRVCCPCPKPYTSSYIKFVHGSKDIISTGGMPPSLLKPPSLLLFLLPSNHPWSKWEKIWVDENIYRPIWVTYSHYCGLKAISLMSNGGAVSVLWTFLHLVSPLKLHRGCPTLLVKVVGAVCSLKEKPANTTEGRKTMSTYSACFWGL